MHISAEDDTMTMAKIVFGRLHTIYSTWEAALSWMEAMKPKQLYIQKHMINTASDNANG